MRAIIVDDEAPARRRLRGVLQQISSVTRIDECASGRDAVELLRRGAPDLVFLDIQMPDLDGFAVAASASEERPPRSSSSRPTRSTRCGRSRFRHSIPAQAVRR